MNTHTVNAGMWLFRVTRRSRDIPWPSRHPYFSALLLDPNERKSVVPSEREKKSQRAPPLPESVVPDTTGVPDPPPDPNPKGYAAPLESAAW